jgi:hypothetical protein
MTRKDYEWFADLIGVYQKELPWKFVQEIEDYFEAGNPKFDREKFEKRIELD